MSTQSQQGRQVVVITHSKDINGILRELQAELGARGAHMLRFNSDEFPVRGEVFFSQDDAGGRLTFRQGGSEVTLGPRDAVWYRRARWGGQLPQDMDKQLRHGCVEETEALLRGVLAAAPCPIVDSPELVRKNGHKPFQLRLAQSLGLATPRTLMTNDAQAAREFMASCPRGVVAKMLSAFSVFNDTGEEQVVFTTALSDQHLDKLDGLRYCPMVFQERVEKQVELRVTAVGNRLFAAAVDSQATAGAEVDWRERGVTLLQSWQPYTLPRDVEDKLHRYMTAIGMQYSAIDLIVEPSGRHVFLEANPAGECFWLQHNCPHFPLSAALADVLLDVPGTRRRFSEGG
ncbi:MAG TPA: MvdD family ATP-grasp ribosomal peptide maturase [Pseudomonadota bacterium]|nr:MvdD family ATP-grasp ribosomal peptide maturase [Pseudomonadota bacterium]